MPARRAAMQTKKRKISLDCLGLPALLQLQAQGVNVSQQLLARKQGDLVRVTAPHPPGPARANKFGVAAASDRQADGITFASRLEATVYLLLKERGIRFERQPEYVLQEAFVDAQGKHHRSIRYVGDFLIHGPGQDYLVDTKGVKTPMFKLKEKLLLKQQGRVIYCFRKVNELLLFLAENKLIGPS